VILLGCQLILAIPLQNKQLQKPFFTIIIMHVVTLQWLLPQLKLQAKMPFKYLHLKMVQELQVLILTTSNIYTFKSQLSTIIQKVQFSRYPWIIMIFLLLLLLHQRPIAAQIVIRILLLKQQELPQHIHLLLLLLSHILFLTNKLLLKIQVHLD